MRDRDRFGRKSDFRRKAVREPEPEDPDDLEEADEPDGDEEGVGGEDEGRPSSRRGRLAGRKGRRGGKGKKGRKRRVDLVPLGIVAALVAAGGGGFMVYRSQGRKLVGALGSDSADAFDAAAEVAKAGTARTEDLCRIMDRGGPGGMAAASALALVLRRPGAVARVLPAVEARLERTDLPELSRRAYAAALAQSRNPGAEAKAAGMLAGATPETALVIVQGLAQSETGPAASAVGVALGHPQAAVADFAEAAIRDWQMRRPGPAATALKAALASGNTQAQARSARLSSKGGGDVEAGAIVPLLSNESAEVRAKALSALAGVGVGAGPGEAGIADKVGAMLASPSETSEVKSAALDVIARLGINTGGEAALRILRTGEDPGLRARAAVVVGATRPPEARDALLRALRQEDAPREVVMGALMGLRRMGPQPRDERPAVARKVLEATAGGDATVNGLTLLALESLAGKDRARYTRAKWETWVRRREWEEETARRIRVLLERNKADYEKHHDPEKAKEDRKLQEATQALQDHVRSKACDPEDRDALQATIQLLIDYHRELKKAMRVQ